MSKPADFFIGIQDFFAVLMPGAAATYLAAAETGTKLEGQWASIAFLFASYVLGHLLFAIAARFDVLYDVWRSIAKDAGEDHAFAAATALRGDTSKLKGESFSHYKWCLVYVTLRAPGVRFEIDRHEATSKFFRTFILVLLLVAGLVWASTIGAAEDHECVISPVAFGAAVLCFWLFCEQRWKRDELTFAYAVLLSERKDGD